MVLVVSACQEHVVKFQFSTVVTIGITPSIAHLIGFYGHNRRSKTDMRLFSLKLILVQEWGLFKHRHQNFCLLHISSAK